MLLSGMVAQLVAEVVTKTLEFGAIVLEQVDMVAGINVIIVE